MELSPVIVIFPFWLKLSRPVEIKSIPIPSPVTLILPSINTEYPPSTRIPVPPAFILMVPSLRTLVAPCDFMPMLFWLILIIPSFSILPAPSPLIPIPPFRISITPALLLTMSAPASAYIPAPSDVFNLIIFLLVAVTPTPYPCIP